MQGGADRAQGVEEAGRGAGAAGGGGLRAHDADADDRGDDGARLRVVVRYFAGAAAAAGLEEEVVLLDRERRDGGDGATLAGLLEHLAHVHPALRPVLAVASTLVDELAVTDGAVRLRDGEAVDVLPPFAGG